MQSFPEKISAVMRENVERMKEYFHLDKTVKYHFFSAGKAECCVVFIDGMTNSALINEYVIKPAAQASLKAAPEERLAHLEKDVVQAGETSQQESWSELLQALVRGDSLVFCDGCARALIVGSKGYERRSISEPDGEVVMKGPREGLTEVLLSNIAMLRRKVCSEKLRFEFFELGETTKTACCICYIDGTADARVLAELRERAGRIRIDGVLDSNYVTELIRENRFSPFRNVGTTERPDIVAAKLLEGRAAMLVDGSPVAITVPHIFIEHLQSNEDYYISFYFAGINRMLRLIGFLLSVSIAPVYIAMVTHHHELLPTTLLVMISHARQGVPFSSLSEALILLLAFEVMREAGSRMPSQMGQTLSVVGALVVGQAAVAASMVSAPMLIVIAFSGVTGLISPKLKSVVIIARVGLILMADAMGMYGYVMGMIWLAANLASQRSFGVPMLASVPLMEAGDGEDSFVRAPFNRMKKFGRFLAGEKHGKN